jgi:hypothetical protein
MLPSHDARLRQHRWYLRAGPPHNAGHLSSGLSENGTQP